MAIDTRQVKQWITEADGKINWIQFHLQQARQEKNEKNITGFSDMLKKAEKQRDALKKLIEN